MGIFDFKKFQIGKIMIDSTAKVRHSIFEGYSGMLLTGLFSTFLAVFALANALRRAPG